MFLVELLVKSSINIEASGSFEYINNEELLEKFNINLNINKEEDIAQQEELLDNSTNEKHQVEPQVQVQIQSSSTGGIQNYLNDSAITISNGLKNNANKHITYFDLDLYENFIKSKYIFKHDSIETAKDMLDEFKNYCRSLFICGVDSV